MKAMRDERDFPPERQKRNVRARSQSQTFSPPAPYHPVTGSRFHGERACFPLTSLDLIRQQLRNFGLTACGEGMRVRSVCGMAENFLPSVSRPWQCLGEDSLTSAEDARGGREAGRSACSLLPAAPRLLQALRPAHSAPKSGPGRGVPGHRAGS